MKTYFV
jgi:hypothetical protein